MTALDRFNAWLFAHQDKVAHFAGGSLLALAGLLCGIRWGHDLAMALTLALPISLGFAKELWDAKHPPHQADPADFLATVGGAIPVWLGFLIGRM